MREVSKRYNTDPVVVNTFKEVGEHLKRWRKLYHLKAKQVAERAGISTVTLSKVENGDYSIGMNAFLEVLKALGLLDQFSQSLDPLNSDLGRARLTDQMPKRIRN